MDPHFPIIVIDAGAAFIKCGALTQTGEKTFGTQIFPSQVAQRKTNPAKLNYYQLQQLRPKVDVYEISPNMAATYPIEDGIVRDWDLMETMWTQIFNKTFQIHPDECLHLHSETPGTPRVHRERAAQIMFESFFAPAYLTVKSPTLALLAAGLTTGTVLDLGSDLCHVTPVYDGHTLEYAHLSNKLGGKTLTEALGKHLWVEGHRLDSLKGDEKHQVLQDIKETVCEVDCMWSDSNKESSYILPDGTSILFPPDVGAKVLFHPFTAWDESKDQEPSLHEMVFDTIMNKSPLGIHASLVSNIVLCGGSSMFPGLGTRIETELRSLIALRTNSPILTKIKVHTPANRKTSIYEGGCILASQGDSFLKKLWTKEEYDEFGPNIVNKKF